MLLFGEKCLNLHRNFKSVLMRRYICPLTLTLSVVMLLASCLDSDDDYTLYDDAALTEFGLSTAVIFVLTTDSLGEDSVYTSTTTDVADYAFTIDQYAGEVYNVDSLPKTVDATQMLCTFATKNSGIAIIQSIERSDSAAYLTTSDTTDFSEPRIVKVYATSGNYTRTYTITVNVHKEIADSFQWDRMANNNLIASFRGMKAVFFDDEILLFGSNGTSTGLYSTPTSDGNTWTTHGVVMGSDAYSNVIIHNDTLLVLDDNALLASTDGYVFDTLTVDLPVTTLLGGCSTEIYGMSEDTVLMSSPDGGLSWVEEELGDDADLFPTIDFSGCSLDITSLSNTEDAFIFGNRSTTTHYEDTIAHGWRKILEYNDGSKTYSWEHIYTDISTVNQLPRLNGLTVMATKGELVAVGGAGRGACEEQAFTQVYVSSNHGASWETGDYYAFPDDFITSIAHFTATADDDGHIWVICGTSGQVWKGRLNRMGWTAN